MRVEIELNDNLQEKTTSIDTSINRSIFRAVAIRPETGFFQRDYINKYESKVSRFRDDWV
jgi:hypothetical protein